MYTIEELQQKEAEIATEINKIPPNAAGCYPVIDGIINPEYYIKAKYKILWILKEANYGGKSPAPGNLLEFYRKALKPEEITKNPTTKGVLLASHRILSDLTPLVAFQSIAYINIKKIPGSGSSQDSEIQDAYSKHESLLLKQIETYQPDIIICGHTLNYFNVLNFRQGECKSMDMGQLHYFCFKDRLYINAYHPANHGQVSDKDYCDKIFAAVSYWEETRSKNP